MSESGPAFDHDTPPIDIGGVPVLWTDPEQELLEARLREAEDVLVEVEGDLLTLREELRAFTDRHNARLAPLYAALDALDARIAAELARASGDPADARAAQQARDRADASDEFAEDARKAHQREPAVSKPPATPALRDVYRALARRCHPDAAGDEDDAQHRHEFMARVNDAYSRRDLEALQRLTSEWDAEPDREPSSGPGRLAWLRRTLDAVLARLAEVRATIEGLRTSEMGRLYLAHRDDAEALLDMLDHKLNEQIARRRTTLEEVERWK